MTGLAEVILVGPSGERHKTILPGDDWFTGITRSDDNAIYVSCVDSSCIQIICGDKLTVFKFVEFAPSSLTFLPLRQSLLVSTFANSDRNELYLVTEKREEKQKLPVHLLSVRDVAVNAIGDICVTDSDKNQVVILHDNFRLKTSYHGVKMKNAFRPWGVTCDGDNNFIVADPGNNILHYISPYGINIACYNTTQDCSSSPYYVDMSPSKCLWVGFRSTNGGSICSYDIC